jgi:COMPASS component SWD3
MNRSQAYQILGLPPSQVSMAQVKEAYRNLARKWHPDRFNDPIEKQKAEEYFKSINAAYEYLKSNPEWVVTAADVRAEATRASKSSVSKTSNSSKMTAGELYQEASLLGKEGRFEAAIELLSLAIKLSPKYAQAYRYRGFIRSVLGFEMSAEADLRRARAIDAEFNANPQTTHASHGKSNNSSQSHRAKVPTE